VISKFRPPDLDGVLVLFQTYIGLEPCDRHVVTDVDPWEKGEWPPPYFPVSGISPASRWLELQVQPVRELCSVYGVAMRGIDSYRVAMYLHALEQEIGHCLLSEGSTYHGNYGGAIIRISLLPLQTLSVVRAPERRHWIRCVRESLRVFCRFSHPSCEQEPLFFSCHLR
jgi:hypothetical protein